MSYIHGGPVCLLLHTFYLFFWGVGGWSPGTDFGLVGSGVSYVAESSLEVIGDLSGSTSLALGFRCEPSRGQLNAVITTYQQLLLLTPTVL